LENGLEHWQKIKKILMTVQESHRWHTDHIKDVALLSCGKGNPVEYCWACEYKEQTDDSCLNCIINWNSGHCSKAKGEYSIFCNAETRDGKIKWARKIIKLHEEALALVQLGKIKPGPITYVNPTTGIMYNVECGFAHVKPENSVATPEPLLRFRLEFCSDNKQSHVVIFQILFQDEKLRGMEYWKKEGLFSIYSKDEVALCDGRFF